MTEPFIPWWARLLARVPTQHRCVFDYLIMLGFWDLADGDWYVNGHWNWRCWEVWEREFARYHLPPDCIPKFPRLMRRLFT